MADKNTFPAVASQVINFNNNLVDMLTKINQLITSSSPSVTLNLTDKSGVAKTFTLPSFGFLKSEIDRLNNNINSIYSINTTGSLIQPSSNNIFQKVVTVDLNKEPSDVSNLNLVSSFKSQRNYFFDNLLNPVLSVEFDLGGKIDDNIRKCLVRRYIISFDQDAQGNFTANGQSALNSFNTLYRNNNNIDMTGFENWYQTTPGITDPTNIDYEEQIIDLEPNNLQFNGIFSVLSIDTDTVNNLIWYTVNTLQYADTQTNEIKQLAVNDELIINLPQSSTRYKITQISTANANPRLVLTRVEGIQPIPVGVGTLKFYSPIIYSKKLQVNIGYNERNVVFVKALDTDNYILSKNWSTGVGYWTNDLKLNSSDAENGKTMDQYYVDTVYDYGEVLKDLVAKKIPNKFGAPPDAPTLNVANFKVVQINTHLTNNADSNNLKNMHNQATSLKTQITQINSAIQNTNKKIKATRFTSDAQKNQNVNDLNKLQTTLNSTSKLYSSVISNINQLAASPNVNIAPSYAVRGFWLMPPSVVTNKTLPQQVVQFKVSYRKLSKDGSEAPLDTYNIADTASTNSTKKVTAVFSNWTEFTTPALKRVYDSSTNTYSWQLSDMTSADAPAINQLEIPIKPNEIIEVNVKSISEVGFPDSPVESDYSESIQIPFPDNLSSVIDNSSFISQNAVVENASISLQADLDSKGLSVHLADTTIVNDKTYLHDTESILSGFKDANGNVLDLFTYLKSLENKISNLETQISLAKGVLQVIIYRNNNQTIVQNGATVNFTIECEDYLDPFTGTNIPTGRVYANNIYVVKDFLIKFKNPSTSSPLGLLSNRLYNSSNNPDVYNSAAPQVFWVDDQNELIVSNVTGQSNTQIDNQFLWLINYDGVNQTSVSKISDNIGNSFVTNNNNSITNILSSSEFNVGYSENGILNFVGNNTSLLDTSKWVDTTISVASTNKLLTTIHPVVTSLSNIVETNSSKIHTLDGTAQSDINIPLNIYFKMNALDAFQTGANYQYINLNGATTTVRHIKKLKFLLENEAENRPFVFTIVFTMNRNKVVIRKNLYNTPVQFTQNNVNISNIA